MAESIRGIFISEEQLAKILGSVKTIKSKEDFNTFVHNVRASIYGWLVEQAEKHESDDSAIEGLGALFK